MKHEISVARYREWVAMRQAGMTYMTIAWHYGIDEQVVRHRLARGEPRARRGASRNPRLVLDLPNCPHMDLGRTMRRGVCINCYDKTRKRALRAQGAAA